MIYKRDDDEQIKKAAKRRNAASLEMLKASFGYESKPLETDESTVCCVGCSHFSPVSRGHRGLCALGNFGVLARGRCKNIEARK